MIFNINEIKKNIPDNLRILVVTKGRSISEIIELIKLGHTTFGENKLQEAQQKWLDIKEQYPHIKLHMIGHIQTNKLKKIIKLFDVIETIDNYKIAENIAKLSSSLETKPDLFVQVNIGNEPQKSGISVSETKNFVRYCQNILNLNIIGLMAIAPKHHDPKPFFIKLKELADELQLKQTSMGMSDDYKQAIEAGATQIRLGRIIFNDS